MWRYFRKRRALRAYRTTLVQQLRRTYGRKLYYSVEEVQTAVRDLRGAAEAFDCYAFAMFCERDAFDAYHAARGEACDYDGMRGEVFAHVANVPVPATDAAIFDGGCSSTHEAGGHHDVGGHHDAGGHHDVGSHGDFGGGHDVGGGGDFGGGHH